LDLSQLFDSNFRSRRESIRLDSRRCEPFRYFDFNLQAPNGEVVIPGGTGLPD
jgi:hypothetical protein